MLVADQLHFNVAWPGEVALNIDLIATKEVFCFALCGLHRLLHICFGLHDLHAASATTEGSLNGNRPTEISTEVFDFLCRGAELCGARNDGCTAAQCCFTARDFVAHFVDCFWWWSDELNTHRSDGACEVGVLAEEAIARVNAIGAAVLNGLQDGLGIEVTLSCGLAP